MHNSKLIKLLQSLTNSETKHFLEFIQSPYFNKHSNVYKLGKFVCSFSGDYLNTNLTKEKAGKAVFKNQKYKPQQLSDIMSYLSKLLEDFISCTRFMNQSLLRKQFLLEELKERNSNSVFQMVSKEFMAQLDKNKLRDHNFHYHTYLFESESDAFFIKNENRKFHESIQRKADNLDIFYLSAKLKTCCEMINRKNIVAADYELHMLDEIMSYINSSLDRFKNVPAITIYHRIIMTLTESDNVSHYSQLIKLLDKNYLYFSKEEARQMYDFAQNYCIKKINSGHVEFGKEILKLYKNLLARKIIFEGKYLSQWDYKNIATIALREEEYEWTKKFILEYKEHIVPEFRDNAFAYNMASYYYAVENYKDALKLLQKVEFTDVFYHLGSKSLLLKAYYEMDNAESFYSLISAFRVYLRRNKYISQSQFTNHLNLINLAKKLYDLKYNNYSKFIFKRKLENIKNKLNSNKNIANIVWLKEKVNEFEK